MSPRPNNLIRVIKKSMSSKSRWCSSPNDNVWWLQQPVNWNLIGCSCPRADEFFVSNTNFLFRVFVGTLAEMSSFTFCATTPTSFNLNSILNSFPFFLFRPLCLFWMNAFAWPIPLPPLNRLCRHKFVKSVRGLTVKK